LISLNELLAKLNTSETYQGNISNYNCPQGKMQIDDTSIHILCCGKIFEKEDQTSCLDLLFSPLFYIGNLFSSILVLLCKELLYAMMVYLKISSTGELDKC